MTETKKYPTVTANNGVDAKNPEYNQYNEIEKLVNKQIKEREQLLPENPIDTAHLLIENSDSSSLMLEIDKEIKLANLDRMEQYLIGQFASVWNDIEWMKRQQQRKQVEAINRYGELYDTTGEEAFLETIEAHMQELEQDIPKEFDEVGAFKKARFIAVLSRGKYGFERIQQVKTISEYKMETTDKTENKPAFMQRFGGFRK